MNRKVNTILFLLAATLFNIIIIVLIFVVGFALLGQFVLPYLGVVLRQLILIVLFCGSLIASYLIYNKSVRWLTTRYSLENYLEPIFRLKGGNKR